MSKRGFLRGTRHLILDRDTKYTDEFCKVLARERIHLIRLPAAVTEFEGRQKVHYEAPPAARRPHRRGPRCARRPAPIFTRFFDRLLEGAAAAGTGVCACGEHWEHMTPEQREQLRAAFASRSGPPHRCVPHPGGTDRKSTRLNSSHLVISYAVFCLKKK